MSGSQAAEPLLPDELFLLAFGTGFRNGSSLTGVVGQGASITLQEPPYRA